MSASGASTISSSGSNVLVNAGRLLQELEVGASLVDVLFVVYDIDDSITEKTKESLFEKPVSLEVNPSESSKATDGTGEGLVQDQAQKLYSALDGISKSLPSQTELGFGIEDACADESLCSLALAIREQATTDDHTAALALEKGRDLPAITQCQKVVQDHRFYGLFGEGLSQRKNGPESNGQRCQRVVTALVKQGDIDVKYEILAWRNGRKVLDQTHCQMLFEHREFQALFGDMKRSCYESLRPQAKGSATDKGLDGKPSGKEENRVDCVGCCDSFLALDCLQAICGHFFCEGCIVMLANLCIKDEGSYPMKCCKQAISSPDVTPFLDETLRRLFAAACLEFGTPSQNRIYCPKETCSQFLGSSAAYREGQTVTCKACNISICATCKERGHPGDSCEQNQLMEQLRQLALEKQWGTCPKCGAIIERTEGCNHMVCRCKEQFCYKCGKLWEPKTCPC